MDAKLGLQALQSVARNAHVLGPQIARGQFNRMKESDPRLAKAEDVYRTAYHISKNPYAKAAINVAAKRMRKHRLARRFKRRYKRARANVSVTAHHATALAHKTLATAVALKGVEAYVKKIPMNGTNMKSLNKLRKIVSGATELMDEAMPVAEGVAEFAPLLI